MGFWNYQGGWGSQILVGDSQHFFRRPGILRGELANQGQVCQSLLEEHDNRLVVDLQDNVSLIAKMLDKFLEGLSRLLKTLAKSQSTSGVRMWHKSC
jgi:hypothetical protein